MAGVAASGGGMGSQTSGQGGGGGGGQSQPPPVSAQSVTGGGNFKNATSTLQTLNSAAKDLSKDYFNPEAREAYRAQVEKARAAEQSLADSLKGKNINPTEIGKLQNMLVNTINVHAGERGRGAVPATTPVESSAPAAQTARASHSATIPRGEATGAGALTSFSYESRDGKAVEAVVVDGGIGARGISSGSLESHSEEPKSEERVRMENLGSALALDAASRSAEKVGAPATTTSVAEGEAAATHDNSVLIQPLGATELETASGEAHGKDATAESSSAPATLHLVAGVPPTGLAGTRSRDRRSGDAGSDSGTRLLAASFHSRAGEIRALASSFSREASATSTTTRWGLTALAALLALGTLRAFVVRARRRRLPQSEATVSAHVAPSTAMTRAPLNADSARRHSARAKQYFLTEDPERKKWALVRRDAHTGETREVAEVELGSVVNGSLLGRDPGRSYRLDGTGAWIETTLPERMVFSVGDPSLDQTRWAV